MAVPALSSGLTFSAGHIVNENFYFVSSEKYSSRHRFKNSLKQTLAEYQGGLGFHRVQAAHGDSAFWGQALARRKYASTSFRRRQYMRKCSPRAEMSPDAPNTQKEFQAVVTELKDKAVHLSLGGMKAVKMMLPLAIMMGSIYYLAGGERVLDTGKKKGKKTKAKTMALENRREWTKNLPLVQERIPYTDILELSAEKRLKHILFHPNTQARARPETVLVVLADDRVVRTVLPVVERDTVFWSEWDKKGLGQSVVEVYTPPPPEPEFQEWLTWGPSLRWAAAVRDQIRDIAKEWREEMEEKERIRQLTKSKQKAAQENEMLASRQRLEMLAQEREERMRQHKEREAALKRDKAERARAEKEAAKQGVRETAQQRGRREAKELVASTETAAPGEAGTGTGVYRWSGAESNLSYALGIVFFVVFYRVVVLGLKKQQKDYEDREKIRALEEEERRKIEEYEKEMELEELTGMAEPKKTEDMSEEEKKKAQELKDNAALALGMKFMKSGAKVKRARGKRPQYMDMDEPIKFEDVAGLGNIRQELEEVVDFFRYGERYRRRGSRIPGGILLSGAPGTGKTLLAKAVAGEAGVNFFSISASQFVEIYVGVGASRVRALYNEARENAPAVVFIDELDAVGRQRGLSEGSGSKERDATLNQLLTCLDGFEGRGEVITIAATNRPDILDSALVRPGRMDRKIFIPKPSTVGRLEILQLHARTKPVAEDVDYFAVAEAARGMVGAQLVNLLDTAALSILRKGRDEITTDDLLEAVQLEIAGFKDERERTEDHLQKIALDEAARVAVAFNFPAFTDIKIVSLNPRMGEEKASSRMRMELSAIFSQSHGKRYAMEYMTIQLAGRAADELWNGFENMSPVWSDTVDYARKMARDLVWTGLSSDPGMYALPDCITEEAHMVKLDKEAEEILNTCYERSKQILDQNRELVNQLRERLLSQRLVQGEEVKQLVEQYGKLLPPPPSIKDIREARVKEFMENMIAEKRTARDVVSA